MKDSTSISTTSVDSAAANTYAVASTDTNGSAQVDTTCSATLDSIATVEVAATSPDKEDNSIGRGLELMVIGMLTVFTILLIVINLGKLLIRVVNAVAPEEKAAPKKAAAATSVAIDANTMAILEQTVNQITGGKGHVASAKKI